MSRLERIAPHWWGLIVLGGLLLSAPGFPFSDSAALLWDARKTADEFWAGDWAVLFYPQGMRASLADNGLSWLAVLFESDQTVLKLTQLLILLVHGWVFGRWARSKGVSASWLLMSPLILMSMTQLLRESFFVPALLASVAFAEYPLRSGVLLAVAFAIRPVECLVFAPLLWAGDRSTSWVQKRRTFSVAAIGGVIWLLLSARQMSGWLSLNLLSAPVAWELSHGHASNPLAVFGLVAGIDWVLVSVSFAVNTFRKRRVPKTELLILLGMVLFMFLRSHLHNPLLRFFGIPSLLICFLIWKNFVTTLEPSLFWQRALVGARASLVFLALMFPASRPLLAWMVGQNRIIEDTRTQLIVRQLPAQKHPQDWATITLYPSNSQVPRLSAPQLNLISRSLGLGHRFQNHRGNLEPLGPWIAGPYPGKTGYDYLAQRDLAAKLEGLSRGTESKVKKIQLETNGQVSTFLYSLGD